VSDVYLTESSGLLHHLLPGDVVLADRRFTIKESVYRSSTPSFHTTQLSELEVDVSVSSTNTCGESYWCC